MEIMIEKDRESNWKFFLDGEKGVLLDFSKKNTMLFAARYLCDNVTALTMKNNAYYIDDYKYLDKDEMIKYIDETFDEIRNGVIKGHTYLCSEYHGKYSDIIQTYKQMLDEIKLKNYKIIGIPIEQYIDGSGYKENNDFVIKVMIPIRIN